MEVLILHGIDGHAGNHWQEWLRSELSSLGHHVKMPNLPNAGQPERQAWLEAVKSEVGGTFQSDLVIVGHSLGVTTALDYIEQITSTLRGLVSVAGFADDYGSSLNSYFLRAKSIDFNHVRQYAGDAHVLYGNDDPYVSSNALANLAYELQVEPVIIPGGGHLNTGSGFSTFPLLLATIAGMS